MVHYDTFSWDVSAHFNGASVSTETHCHIVLFFSSIAAMEHSSRILATDCDPVGKESLASARLRVVTGLVEAGLRQIYNGNRRLSFCFQQQAF